MSEEKPKPFCRAGSGFVQRRGAIIVGAYLGLGFGWLLAFSSLVEMGIHDPSWRARLHLGNAGVVILVSAGALYCYLRRHEGEVTRPELRDGAGQSGSGSGERETLPPAVEDQSEPRELQSAIQELKETQRQLIDQERNRALMQMASGIAHDCNNSLAIIRGYLDMLLERPEKLQDGNKVMRYLKSMNRAAVGATETLRQMRKFYRTVDDHELCPVDLNEIVTDTVTMTRPRWQDQAQRKGATINVRTKLNADAKIRGNDTELSDMLTNLIFNAVDAMPTGGEIELETSNKAEAVQLDVRDTGIGMGEETQRRCLEPFFSTKGEHGTGVGLSAVSGIIRRHEAHLEIESQKGGGTTFTVQFPKTFKERDEATASEALLSRSLGILVIDDDSGIQDLLAEQLQNDGHTVDIAADGVEGLQKFYASRYDVVMTNLAMPTMNGDELARKIKDMAPKKPVILMTGFAEVLAAGEEYDSIDTMLAKPLTANRLREALTRLTIP